MTTAPSPVPQRRRLPNRRPSLKQELEAGGQVVTVDIGFHPETGRPNELFLTAGKEGSLLNSLLADAAVVISVALQCGVPPAALAKSMGRLPELPVTPGDLDRGQPARLPSSPIGAALDFVSAFEAEPSRTQENASCHATKIVPERP